MTKETIGPNLKQYRVQACRICNSMRLYQFLSLGSMPIPNGFLTKSDLKKSEPRYPLSVFVCEDCSLVQLTHVVPAHIMFRNYLYIPSTSSTMIEHFKSMAQDIVQTLKLKPQSLVIDIGSNDGTLLGNFKDNEMRVLGIDPASNLAQVARLKGVETIDNFFTSDLAKKILKEKGTADVITGTNVFAHIDDLRDACKGISMLLNKKSVFIVEFPYLPDLLSKNEFDTIYHEHLSYFSLRPLISLFNTYNMGIFDVKRTSIHGGSMRIYVAKKPSGYKVQPIVQEIVKEELLKKLDKRIPYDDFARRTKTIKRDLKNYLQTLRKQGKRVVGYGASAKGNVLLNYCNIGTEIISYIVDSIHYKQGRFTPGTHIPIYPETRLEKDNPTHALLLAWNFADEILRKQAGYRARGGQFIITIPYLRIE